MIVKIRDLDGMVRFIRVNATTPQEAMRQAQAQVRGGEQIEWARPPGHQAVTGDRDFAALPAAQKASLGGGSGFQFGGSGNAGTTPGSGPNALNISGIDAINNMLSGGASQGGAGRSFGEPATGDPGGSGSTASTSGTGIGAPGDVDMQRQDPAAAYRAFVQRMGGPTTGVAGNAIQNAGRNADSIFKAQAALSGDPNDTLSGFFDRVIGNNSISSGLGNAARSALLGLANLGSGGNAVQQEFLNPTSYEDGFNTRMTALAAINPFLRDEFGAQLDQRLGQRFGDLAFQRQQPMNLAAFLRDQLGIR